MNDTIYFYILVIGYILGAVLVSYLAGFIWKKIIHLWLGRSLGILDEKLTKSSQRPFVFLIFFILLNIGKSLTVEIPRLQQFKLENIVGHISFLGLILVGAWWFERILTSLLDWYLDKSSSGLGATLSDNHMFRFLKRMLKIVIYFIVFTIILGYFNISISGILATAGVASLAISLAAQDTLGNMLAGFMVMLDRPYKVGDRIETNGLLGDVVDIGGRTTRLRTLDNTVIVIPNSDLASSRVINHTNPTPRTIVKLLIGVGYDSDLEKVKNILNEIMVNNPKVLKDPPPASYFVEFGESSLNLQCLCSINNYTDILKVRDELNSAIKSRFEAENIEIPYPKRDVNLYNGV